MEITEEISIPKDEIFYFKDGRVEGINTYCNVNNSTIANSTYRRWGAKIFESHFDEHHGIYVNNQEKLYETLPDQIKMIFEANTRDAINQLRIKGNLSEFVIDLN